MKYKILVFLLFFWTYQTQAGDGFITTWEVSANQTIHIPISDAFSSYHYSVDWGDGTVKHNITGHAFHTYSDAGTYTIEITGRFPAIRFGQWEGPELTIRSIEQWGNIEWESMRQAFSDCLFLKSNATDTPDLTRVSDLSEMFKNNLSFNKNIGNWDVSNVTNFHGAFHGANSFNQDISNWDVSKGTDFSSMFENANAFNQDISTWNVSNGTNFNTMFSGARSFNQAIGTWDVSKGTDFSVMFGSATSFNQDISNWDVANGINFSYMFANAHSFNQAIGTWDVSNGIDFRGVFANATTFNQDIGTWDVSKGKHFSSMFGNATSFNQDLSNWDVSKGEHFSSMFMNAHSFNQAIGTWDVSSGIDFRGMFANATSFNQDIGSWDVSKGEHFRLMFYGAVAFNQAIGNWDVSNGVDFSSMFVSATSFNQDISNWDVSKGEDFSSMFNRATAFNQDVSSWDVSKGTDFRGMFSGATSFNQAIGNWDVSSGRAFGFMFSGATSFNQDISNWDVSNGGHFFAMFASATSFNQDLSNWDVSNGRIFRMMFSRATSFNQNLGTWNIAHAKDMRAMFSDSGMDVNHYDATLIGWAKQTVTSAVQLGATNISYCFAFKARNKLINEYGWQITDGGRKCDFDVTGQVYHDLNQNKERDADEYGLRNQKVMLLPDSCVTLTDSAGNYHFSVPVGDYEVVILPQHHFELSTDEVSYPFSLPKDEAESYSFGLKSTQDLYELTTSLTAAPTRCGFTVPFWLSYQNTGTLLTDGKVKLIPDEAVTFINSSQPFLTNGDTLIWEYSNLKPGEVRQLELSFEMPGVEAIGDSVRFIHLVEAIESNQVAFRAQDSLISEIRCAYDPNDKTATPFGVGAERFTLKEDYLEYRIRFQNTGNDTAFNVIIRDTLQADFDLSTFEVIASSHPMRTQLEVEDGALAFYFDDILLPDSLADEPNSHGYITFKIKAKSGLPDHTKLFNTAFIYFDFNPAIQTNYTLNTLVDELPTNKVTGLKFEDISQQVTIFPNPNRSDELVVRFADQLKGMAYLTITDLAGRELRSMQISNLQTAQAIKLDITSLKSGIYFIQLVQDDKRAVKKLIRE
ncbi:MAG: BspA family leucine-rich repeat surface protein [Flammeovirgaceae bacterium]